MDTRQNKNGETISRLGMGLMRLPETSGVIDYPHAEKMIDRLIECGVTYYDTAYFYHWGESETFARRALLKRHNRSAFTIATKMPLGEVERIGGVEKTFAGQLEKLGADYIDYYLLHGINWGGYEHALRLNALKYLEKMKSQGKIRYLGFSFHGPAEDLPKILDAYNWDFVQTQLNYYDYYAQEGKALYETVNERGIFYIVMEPVRGGGLSNCHDEIKNTFLAASSEVSVASWALRWVGSLSGVDVVLSGMSDISHVEDNVNTFSPLKPLTLDEIVVIERVMDKFKALPLIGCTQCRYCDGCPQKINIPGLFGGYDDIVRFGSSWFMANYRKTEKDKLPTSCQNCGLCEKVCPQGLKVTKKLMEVFENYT